MVWRNRYKKLLMEFRYWRLDGGVSWTHGNATVPNTEEISKDEYDQALREIKSIPPPEAADSPGPEPDYSGLIERIESLERIISKLGDE